MPTSGPGNNKQAVSGFTLIELLVVVSIIAIGAAGVSFAMRDSVDTQLEREAQRLASLLEAGRAQSRSSGIPVRWAPQGAGFRFEGVPPNSLPDQWLAEGTQVSGRLPLVLGPEPIIGRQSLTITTAAKPERSLRIATDGLRPFTVSAAEGTP